MDVILHLGAHRTATTTFQTFLARNARPLAEAGVEVWTPDRTRAGLFAGLIQRPQGLTDAEERRVQRSAGVIAVELERLERRGVRTLIVSEENMVGTLRVNLRDAALYPEALVRAARFRAAFGGRVTQVAMAVRGYDAYWASALASVVAQGRPVPMAGLLNRLVASPRTWREVLSDVAHVFPGVPLTVWPFERLGTQPDAQLRHLTGLGLPGLTGQRDWFNPSPRRDKLRMILRLRGERDLATTLPEGDGRWMPFTTDQQAVMRARYSRDIAWLGTDDAGVARLAPMDLAALTVSGQGKDPAGQDWYQTGMPDRGQEYERERQMV